MPPPALSHSCLAVRSRKRGTAGRSHPRPLAAFPPASDSPEAAQRWLNSFPLQSTKRQKKNYSETQGRPEVYSYKNPWKIRVQSTLLSTLKTMRWWTINIPASQIFQKGGLANQPAETQRLNLGLLFPTSSNSKLPLCLFKCLSAHTHIWVSVYSYVGMTFVSREKIPSTHKTDRELIFLIRSLTYKLLWISKKKASNSKYKDKQLTEEIQMGSKTHEKMPNFTRSQENSLGAPDWFSQ